MTFSKLGLNAKTDGHAATMVEGSLFTSFLVEKPSSRVNTRCNEKAKDRVFAPFGMSRCCYKSRFADIDKFGIGIQQAQLVSSKPNWYPDRSTCIQATWYPASPAGIQPGHLASSQHSWYPDRSAGIQPAQLVSSQPSWYPDRSASI